MTAEPGPGEEREPSAAASGPERIFLVVVDDTSEMQNALHFACRRADHTSGRVALLYVIEPPEFQHWLGVERMMLEEARDHAESVLQQLAGKVQALTGKVPTLYIREGRRREELLTLLDEEPAISILVLGAASNSPDPGPLVSYLVSHMGDRLRVPMTLVPGHLREEQIDAMT